MQHVSPYFLPDADAAWISALRKILLEGSKVSPRGIPCIEILSNSVEVDMRRPIVSIVDRRLGYKFLAAEAWWILTGRNDTSSIVPYAGKFLASCSNDGVRFDGAYGPMIVDQIRYVVDTLHDDHDTRQAVMSIWRRNPRPSKDVPCTLTVQWLLRERHPNDSSSVKPYRLHCLDTMRSSDVWMGLPYDTFNFSMLSAMLLLELRQRDKFWNDVDLGKLVVTAGSMHLYERNVADAEFLLNDYFRCPQGQRRNYRALSLEGFENSEEFTKHLALLKTGATLFPGAFGEELAGWQRKD